MLNDENTLIENGYTQFGKNNIVLQNRPGAEVNFNYNYYYPNSEAFASDLNQTLSTLSREYYQLIVSNSEEMYITGVVSASLDRSLTQSFTPPEITERCAGFSEEGINELLHIPALICRENTAYKGETDPNQYCMLCLLQKIQVLRKEVNIAFKPLFPIQQLILCDRRNSIFFGLDMSRSITDLNHSAWSVRKINIFEALEEAGIHFPLAAFSLNK